jgi:hypothetical protein
MKPLTCLEYCNLERRFYTANGRRYTLCAKTVHRLRKTLESEDRLDVQIATAYASVGIHQERAQTWG